MALASTTDYTTITGVTLSGALETRVSALLAMAEEAVLAGAHGQLIEGQEYEDVLLRPVEGVLYLPQRPVVSVASVETVDANGNATALTADTDYRIEAGGDGRPARIVRRRYGRDSWWGTVAPSDGFGQFISAESEVRVTYTAGWDPVPAQIKAICVAMAKSVVDNNGGPQPTYRTVGPFSASYGDGEVQSASMHLTPSAQAVIDKLCKVTGPSSVQMERTQP